MEKYGVVIGDTETKEAAVKKGICPSCGATLLKTTPPVCPECGSYPLEDKKVRNDNED